ncbi:MAG: hypothetical protein AB1758_01905 [Candidatus Eremiobacterota bacterium]
MTIQDQLLAAMYLSFYKDEARFDVLAWLKQNDLGQSAFSTGRDKVEMDIGPGGRNLVDMLANAELIQKRVGTEAVILPKGIDHVEQNELVEASQIATMRQRRFKVLDALQRLQAQSSDQSKAQVGRIMTEAKMLRNDATPTLKELEIRRWVETPAGLKDGWLAITWEGAQALEQLRASVPAETAPPPPPDASGGPVPLSSIKFFD